MRQTYQSHKSNPTHKNKGGEEPPPTRNAETPEGRELDATKEASWADRIPLIGEPLRTAIRQSDYQDQISTTWLRVTLGPYYSFKDRVFARKMGKSDVNLLNNFLLADFNLLCGDPAVTANQVRSYLQSEYAVNPQRLTQLIGVTTISQALTAPELAATRLAMGLRSDLKTKPKTPDKQLPIIPHFQGPQQGGNVSRADIFTTQLQFRQTEED